MQELCGKPLTFGNEDQIKHLRKEAEKQEQYNDAKNQEPKNVTYIDTVIAQCPDCRNESDEPTHNQRYAFECIAGRYLGMSWVWYAFITS